MALIKGGNKVVVGTQEGPLHIFSWGKFGDMDDRLVGHEGSVDCLLPAGPPDAGMLFSGGEDGLVRLVGVQPHRMVKVIGEHGDEPVQAIRSSRCGGLLGTCALDSTIRFWDIRDVRDGTGAATGGGSAEESASESMEGATSAAAGKPSSEATMPSAAGGSSAGDGGAGSSRGGPDRGEGEARSGSASKPAKALAWKPADARRAMETSDFYGDMESGMDDGHSGGLK